MRPKISINNLILWTLNWANVYMEKMRQFSNSKLTWRFAWAFLINFPRLFGINFRQVIRLHFDCVMNNFTLITANNNYAVLWTPLEPLFFQFFSTFRMCSSNLFEHERSHWNYLIVLSTFEVHRNLPSLLILKL